MLSLTASNPYWDNAGWERFYLGVLTQASRQQPTRHHTAIDRAKYAQLIRLADEEEDGAQLTRILRLAFAMFLRIGEARALKPARDIVWRKL